MLSRRVVSFILLICYGAPASVGPSWHKHCHSENCCASNVVFAHSCCTQESHPNANESHVRRVQQEVNSQHQYAQDQCAVNLCPERQCNHCHTEHTDSQQSCVSDTAECKAEATRVAGALAVTCTTQIQGLQHHGNCAICAFYSQVPCEVSCETPGTSEAISTRSIAVALPPQRILHRCFSARGPPC